MIYAGSVVSLTRQIPMNGSKIRIGQIDYANCTPIFTALTSICDSGDYRFVRGVPAELNQMLRRGEIDVCPSSSIEYARSPGSYHILPELSISSIGPVKSVLLFSRVPIEELNNQSIALTVESHTSVALVKIILAKAYGFSNDFRPTTLLPPEALQSFPAMLLIGDKALQAAQGVQSHFVYDLGKLWYDFTGLPFVFALWLVNRKSVARRQREMRALAARILAAKRQAYGTYEGIAASTAERSWMAENALVDYWRTISYDLTSEHLRGVALFFHYAHELRLLTAEPEIVLFS